MVLSVVSGAGNSIVVTKGRETVVNGASMVTREGKGGERERETDSGGKGQVQQAVSGASVGGQWWWWWWWSGMVCCNDSTGGQVRIYW